jgi:phosphoribosylformylglycinamidine synthase
MDLKKAGNLLYLVGLTKDELGGSHFALVEGLVGGDVPTVDAAVAKKTFLAMYAAIQTGTVRACHDLSEGGLAVALAEMAFAGGLGATISLAKVPQLSSSCGEGTAGRSCASNKSDADRLNSAVLLFSESNSRFLCEVEPGQAAAFESALAEVPHACIGEVVDSGKLRIVDADEKTPIVESDLATLKEAWQKPLRW